MTPLAAIQKVAMPVMPVLAMREVSVALPRAGRLVPVLEAFSLSIAAGEMVALVGESGSGKTLAALSVPRLLPANSVLGGHIALDGVAIEALPEPALRRLRGARIGVVFQDPLAALNPSQRVGAQIAEPLRMHLGLSKAAAMAAALRLLDEVGIDAASVRVRQYPHEFSGGMRQRAGIAMALACRPGLLIADEITTGLDPALARQMLDLIGRLRRERGLAVLLVSHDLALLAGQADRVQVLYAGRTVEHGPAHAVLARPAHPYTVALVAACALSAGVPRAIPGVLPEPEKLPPGCRFAPRCPAVLPKCEAGFPAEVAGETIAACLFPGVVGRADEGLAAPAPTAPGPEMLRLRGLTVRYGGRLAVSAVDFSLRRGEALAVVGASGAGKTSLGRALLQMVPYEGEVALDGVVLSGLKGAALQAARRRIQVVFQDPAASLNPALRVGATIEEALILGGMRNRAVLRERCAALLAQVGLDAALRDRWPSTLSGGQAQRVAVARALAAAPAVIVLDEPTASLDASGRANLLALLRDLARERGVAYVVITHDPVVVAALATRVMTMTAGRLAAVVDKSGG